MPNLISIFPSVRRLLRNLSLDLKYGGFLGGTVKTPYSRRGIHDTASTDYEALPYMFDNAVDASDVLVDIGCGKGRVINWWLSRGYTNQIVGLEMDPIVARQTAYRLRNRQNVKIVSGDALLHLPEEGTIFYLFNPFDEHWVRGLKRKMEELETMRAVRIVYYNCVHAHVFDSDAMWTVERIALRPPFHPLATIRARPKAEHRAVFNNTIGNGSCEPCD